MPWQRWLLARGFMPSLSISVMRAKSSGAKPWFLDMSKILSYTASFSVGGIKPLATARSRVLSSTGWSVSSVGLKDAGTIPRTGLGIVTSGLRFMAICAGVCIRTVFCKTAAAVDVALGVAGVMGVKTAVAGRPRPAPAVAKAASEGSSTERSIFCPV